MSLQKLFEKNSKKKLFSYLSIFALISIPVVAYLFWTTASPFDYTFSMIWNRLWHRLDFILWWFFTWLMLTFYLFRLYVMESFKNKKALKFLLWSFVFLLLTVVVPAVETEQLTKRLHTLLALAFFVNLMISLYLFILYLQKTDTKRYTLSMWLFLFIVIWSLAMLFIFWMTWIFELFFFWSLSISLFLISILYKNRIDSKKK